MQNGQYEGGGRGAGFRRDRDDRGGFYQHDDRIGGSYDRGYEASGRGPPAGGRGYRGGRGRGRSRGGYDDRYDGGGGRGGWQDDGWQPAPRGGGGGGRYDGPRSQGGRRGSGRYDWGRASPGGRGPQRRRDTLPDDIAALTELKKHTKQISCLAFDGSTQQLYSGSQDGLVCAWSCASGQLVSSVELEGEVDSLLVESGFLIVGFHQKLEGIIKVWNLATAAEHILTGHKGQVLSLAAGNGCLYSGGQDASLRVWVFNAGSAQFSASKIMTADSGGGHRSSVLSLTTHGPFLFSGDREGSIKVWEQASMQCVQTVQAAHEHAIMRLMVWADNYLLSASLDGSIKVWGPAALPSVLNPMPESTFTGGEESAQSGSRPRVPAKGVLAMFATVDLQSKSVLVVSYVDERCLKLYELPNWTFRGVIPNVMDCRALTSLPGASIIAGEKFGSIKIFQFKEPPMLVES